MKEQDLLLHRRCSSCGKIVSIRVNTEDFIDFRFNNKKCQDCFPYLDVNQREILISGICGECFDKMFE